MGSGKKAGDRIAQAMRKLATTWPSKREGNHRWHDRLQDAVRAAPADASFWFGFWEFGEAADFSSQGYRTPEDWEVPWVPVLPDEFSMPFFWLGTVAGQAERKPQHRQFSSVSNIEEDHRAELSGLLQELQQGQFLDTLLGSILVAGARKHTSELSTLFCRHFLSFEMAARLAEKDATKVIAVACLWPNELLESLPRLGGESARLALDALQGGDVL